MIESTVVKVVMRYMKKYIYVILTTAIVIFFMYQLSPKQEEVIKVQYVYPKIEDISDFITVSGRIAETSKRDIYTKKLAKITAVHCDVGDYVNCGDVIAETVPIALSESDLSDYDIPTSEIISVFKKQGLEIISGYSDESSLRTIYSENTIKSPIDGIITDIQVSEGDNVTSLNKLVTVSDFSQLCVKAKIPEAFSSRISEGKLCEITSESLGGKKYKGEIVKISPTAKYVPSLVGEGETYIEANIALKKITAQLRPGLSVNAKIVVDTEKNAITLPYECIMQDSEKKEFVYCYENGKAVKHYISIGYELEDKAQIKSGITENSKVIFNAGDTLSDGDKVTGEKIKDEN